MFLLLILSCYFLNTSSKLIAQNVEDYKKSDDLVGVTRNFHGGHVGIIGDPLWVLLLNNDEWLNPKLRLGTATEQEQFYYALEAYIKAIRYSPTSRVKKDDPMKPARKPETDQTTRTNEELKEDIMKLINKFVLSTNIEPDVLLTENPDGNKPSIEIYFKGDVSCFIVKLGLREWQYILKTSPFPAWFYEPHDTFKAPLKIPEEIKNTFYSTLLRLLRLILYHPL